MTLWLTLQVTQDSEFIFKNAEIRVPKCATKITQTADAVQMRELFKYRKKSH